MKAQAISSFGDCSVFKTIELPKPKIKPGYVLIRVVATSVNPVDCKVRSGKYSHISPHFQQFCIVMWLVLLKKLVLK